MNVGGSGRLTASKEDEGLHALELEKQRAGEAPPFSRPLCWPCLQHCLRPYIGRVQLTDAEAQRREFHIKRKGGYRLTGPVAKFAKKNPLTALVCVAFPRSTKFRMCARACTTLKKAIDQPTALWKVMLRDEEKRSERVRMDGSCRYGKEGKMVNSDR